MTNQIWKMSRTGLWATLLAAFSSVYSPAVVPADSPVLADTPIANTTSVQVKPNIMLLMDTSNSMKFSHMPDEIEVGSHRATPGGDFEIGYKSYQCNILYYKPTQVYALPKDSTGATLPAPSFSAGYYNAYSEYSESPLVVPSTVVNLGTSFRAYDATTRQYPTSVDPAQPAYYYVYQSSTGAIPESLNYASWPCTDLDTGTSATSSIPTVNPLNAAQTGTWNRVLVSSLTADQQQNFAIWYSYYRTRISMIKSAVSLSFTPLTDSVRVGLITVKPYAALVPTVGASVDSAYYLPIGDFATTQRRNWFAKLFSQVPGGSSPAREGLARVGRHYAGKQDSINLGMSGDPVQYSCQQNFTIMTTDGYWNTAAETRGPVGLDGTTLVGQQDGFLNQTKAKPGSLTGETYNITPRPIWDGYPDTTRVKTEKLLEYTLENCTSLYGSKSTNQNLQSTTQILQSTAQTTESTIQNLQSTAQNLRSTVQNLQSTSQNLQSTAQNLESTVQNLASTTQNLQSTTQNLQSTAQTLQSTNQNLASTTQNLQSTTQNRQSTTQTLQSTNQNLRSTVQNLQNTSQVLQTTSQNTQRTEQITESTTQNLRSTTQNLQSTAQTMQSTNQILRSTTQNLRSTTQNVQSTTQNLQSTAQTLRSTTQNLESTAQNLQSTTQVRVSTAQTLQSTAQNLQSTAQNLQSTTQTRQSTNQNLQSTTQNLQSTVQNLYRTVQIRKTTVQWFQYDSSTELSTPVSSCTAGGTISCSLYVNGASVPTNTAQPYASVAVASCTAQTKSSGNAWTEISCQTVYSPSSSFTPIATCTPVAASAGNSYTATECSTNNTTNVPVQTCTASAASSGNNYTTTTCSTNNTSNVPVATCTASAASSGNSWTTTTCPAPITTGPTPVQTCTAAAASSGNNYTSTTCTPNNTTNVPVQTCTASSAAAGNNWTTTTCSTNNTTNVPVQTCTAATATSGNNWTTTTCSTNNTTNVPVQTCTAATASSGNSWTTTTCTPNNSGPTPVQTCTASSATSGNNWTTTTCSNNNTTNVPVQTCTASAATSGNNWTTTTCSTNNTTNVPVASCTPQTAASGNNWVTRTCPAPVTTGPTAVQTCTAAAASSGNSWTTTTCTPNNTGPTPVQTCTAVAAASGNNWTATTCSTNNTTNVPVQTCTASAATSGNNWTTTTCPAPITTTNVPVQTCTASAATSGNNWTTTTCSTNNTTNVPVASCTASAATSGNNWTTTTCPAPITTGPTAVQTCTAAAAASGNNYTSTTCTPNNTTNVPVQTCTASAASSGNNWTTTTCSTNNTTNVPVQTCTASAATSGNNWTTTTCSTNNTTNVPVASCTPQTAASGNNWVTRTCTGPTILSGPTVVQTCTAVAASAGNGYVATVCGVITNTVAVQTCTPQSPTAGNNWTTITCANNNTTNVPVATCTPQTAAAGNNWTTITCPAPIVTTNVPVATCTAAAASAGNNWTTTTCPAPITTGPTAVQTCTAAAAAAGNNYTSTTCTPNNTTNVPVQTCTASAASSGNAWTTTTCSTNNTTNVPVQTCTASAATSGNNWTTTTCSTNNTTNVPVATCTPQTAASGNSWVTRTCPAPITTGPTPVQTCAAATASAGNNYTSTTCSANNTTNVPVQTCTASAATSGNSWTTTTCSTNNTTNVPVQTCTGSAATSGNNWTTTTCSTNNTTNVPVSSCTPQTAASGNSWVTRTCSTNNTSNVPVQTCTPQTAASGNSWVTRTCSTNNTSNVPVQTCTASGATSGNNWTTTTCSTNNTTNVPVQTCTATAATSGNNWTTTTCPPANTTTNVPVQTCAASAATSGNNWTTTTCSTNNTSNVPVATCTAATATSGNNWTTTTCPAPITTGPTGVSSCTAVAANAGNNYTATTCGTNNTTNVPVDPGVGCTPSAASAGNNWTTTTCGSNNTTNVPVATCTATAASSGNSWTETTCPPPVTTFVPEVYNCVASAASLANNWVTTTCGPGLPGKEQKSRVGTRTTTDLLSGTTLLSSTVSSISYTPSSGYAVTDGICTPLASTLVGPPVQTPDGPATTTQIPPPAVPPNVVGPPSTTYTQTCPGNSWPCTLDEVKEAGSYNSLADVAQYYYVTDLRSGNAWDSVIDPATNKLIYDNDNVPASDSGLEDDRVNWQHMTTYTIALGVSGTLSYDKNYKSQTVGDFADLRTGAKRWPIWPDPSLNYAADGQLYSNPKSIDDFWHTAVNGRGRYFSAGNPADVIDGLRAVLRDLGRKQGSGAAAASSSQTPVQGNNIAYVAKYATTSWSGDIEAHEIDLTTGSIKSPILWSARSKLDARAGYYCDDRKIYLYRSGATNNMVDFKWSTGTCSTVTITESSSTTMSVAGTVTSVSLDTATYNDPANPPTARAQTGALVPRDLKVGDAILANDVITTSAGAVVKVEQVVSPVTTLNASEKTAFDSSKIALLSQYPDMSDGTSGTPDQRTAAQDAALVNFIRGQRAREGFVAKDLVKLYRKRDSVLGDLVDAQPVYVQAPFAAYSDTGYKTFKTDNANRKAMIYAAANDGMLHAFYGGVVSVDGSGVTSIDSTGGREAWAFIPSTVLGDLYKLSDFDYSNRHAFLVDGTPTVGDIYDSSVPAWKTVLVAGLNKGGKAYYALDVTDPDNPKAMWEFKWSATCYNPSDSSPQYADCNLGYTFGKPVITKRKDGKWVVLVTSGYNNVSSSTGDGGGYLYVLDAASGRILSKIATGEGDGTTPSGLAQITNYVDNAFIDNTTKYVYGGDNNGNVWRFNIYDDPATPADETSATLLGVTMDSTGARQPITTRPELGEIAGKPWVYVGTGRLLGQPDLPKADVTDVQKQSVYGFIDVGGNYSSDYPDPTAVSAGLRGVLRPLAMTPQTAANLTPAVGTTRAASCTGTTGTGGTCSRKSGWVLDLPDYGERVNVDMSLTLGTLLFASNVPRNSACNIGGYSWLSFVDYRTGLPVSTIDPVTGNANTVVSAYLGESLAVGLSVMRLPSVSPGGQGKTVAIVMGSGGTPISFAPPVNVPPPIGRRVSWREVLQ